MEFDCRSRFASRLCETYKVESSNLIDVKEFIQEIKATGVRLDTDPRLKEVMARLNKLKPKPSSSVESLKVTREEFLHVIDGNLDLIRKICRSEMVIPEFETFSSNISDLFYEIRNNTNGKVGKNLVAKFEQKWPSSSKPIQFLHDKSHSHLIMIQPASYIPQLARVPAEKWALSICTVDGQRLSIGDVRDKFTIQSTR